MNPILEIYSILVESVNGFQSDWQKWMQAVGLEPGIKWTEQKACNSQDSKLRALNHLKKLVSGQIRTQIKCHLMNHENQSELRTNAWPTKPVISGFLSQRNGKSLISSVDFKTGTEAHLCFDFIWPETPVGIGSLKTLVSGQIRTQDHRPKFTITFVDYLFWLLEWLG